MTTPPATIGEALREAAGRLGRAGIDDPTREAAILLSHRLRCPAAMVYVRREEPLVSQVARLFIADVGRRENREPAALIRGTRAFFGRDFVVTPDVLVPRPETELLVEAVLERAGRGAEVLDVGTGSGCIAVTIAAERPDLRVGAVDVSAAALAVAAKNAEKHAVSDRIVFRTSDLFGEFGPADRGYFDIIVSNPPYVSTPVLPTLEPELKFEPRIALDGGNDGMAVIEPLVSGAVAFLKRGGRLMLEIGFDQAERARALMSAAGFGDVEVIKDFSNHDRIISGVMRGPV